MVEPVAWELAAKVAARVAGQEPLTHSYHYASLAPDFAELTTEAEELVAAETGLRSLAGPARAAVVDRPAWVAANVASFRRLLRPVTAKLAEHMPTGSPLAAVARNVAGVELGVLLGWMATRVLGQYDLLVVDDDGAEADVVYYVGPNVLALEKRYGFPPREFRLWLAIHEVTHRAQFTGVPWMREHFLGLVERSLGGLDTDPRRLLLMMRRAAEAVRAGQNPLDDGGLMVLFATVQQREVLDQVAGLMSLLEGHGDVTMDRAGADRVPSAERFSRILRQRRASTAGLAKLLQKLAGIDAKLAQYEQGERFIARVEEAGGPALVARAWEAPELLPTLGEVRDPDAWIIRVRASDSAGV